jgi:hypothetical protein
MSLEANELLPEPGSVANNATQKAGRIEKQVSSGLIYCGAALLGHPKQLVETQPTGHGETCL